MISAEQVHISIMSKSESGVQFNFTFQNKDNFEMMDELGETIAKIAKHVPGGLLIFYPSYRIMDNVYERWEKSGVL